MDTSVIVTSAVTMLLVVTVAYFRYYRNTQGPRNPRSARDLLLLIGAGVIGFVVTLAVYALLDQF